MRARTLGLAWVLTLAIGACEDAHEYQFVAVPDVAGGDWDRAQFASFDDAGRPLVNFPGVGYRAFDGAQWQPLAGIPNALCSTRETTHEGGVLVAGSGVYEWREGAPKLAIAFADGMCAAAARAGSGEWFAYQNPGTAMLLRGSDGGSWSEAFPGQRLDLGTPSDVLRDAQGNVWVLGFNGIARVARDGKSVTVVADCKHPFYEGCVTWDSRSETRRMVQTTRGVVAPNGDLYFVRAWNTLLTSSSCNLHRVRASDLAIEELSIPSNLPQLNGYDIAPDGSVWAVFGASNRIGSDHYLFKGDGARFEQIARLRSHGFQVAVSNRGTVYAMELGMISSRGMYIVR